MSLQISSDIFEAKFVLATTPQSVDEAASQEPKSEKSERTMSVQPKGSRAQQHSPSPLFRPSSQASTAREHHAEDAEDGNDDDDEYGMDDLDFGEEDFAMIDSLSQVVPSASMIIPAAKVDKRSTLLIPDSGAVRCRKVPREDSPRSEEVIIQHGTPSSSLVGGGDADQDEEEDDMYEILPSTQRDQKAKKVQSSTTLVVRSMDGERLTSSLAHTIGQLESVRLTSVHFMLSLPCHWCPTSACVSCRVFSRRYCNCIRSRFIM